MEEAFIMTKLQILAVDDEKALCHLLALNLEDAGYEVTEASSGLHALQLLTQSKFDLVISDIRMPDGDGIFLLNEIKKRNPQSPPFILVTAFSDFSEAEAYHLGSENLLRKPVDYDDLVRCVAASLKNRNVRWHADSNHLKPDYHIEKTLENYTTARTNGLINIGNGGLFLHTLEPLPRVGHIVKFNVGFTDGTNSPLKGFGICRWVRENSTEKRQRGFGIEFQAIDRESQNYFNHLWDHFPSISFIPIA